MTPINGSINRRIFLNPHIVGFFESGNFVIKEPNLKKSFIINPKLFCIILTALKGFDEKEFSTESLEVAKAIDFLLTNKVLIYASDPLFTRAYNSLLVQSNKYATQYLHTTMVNYPFLDYADEESHNIDRELMKKYAGLGKRPPAFKDYPLKNKIYLKSFNDFDWDILSDKKIHPNLDILGLFLSISYGKTMEILWPTHKIRKTVPSGGSKHPTEIYFLFTDNIYIPAGIYHYDVRNHALDALNTRKNYLKQILRICGLKETPKGCILIFYTSFFERSMWRYRDVRSTRAVLADIGHVAQGAQINADILDLVCRPQDNYDPAKIGKIFELDPYQESVLYTQYLYAYE